MKKRRNSPDSIDAAATVFGNAVECYRLQIPDRCQRSLSFLLGLSSPDLNGFEHLLSRNDQILEENGATLLNCDRLHQCPAASRRFE